MWGMNVGILHDFLPFRDIGLDAGHRLQDDSLLFVIPNEVRDLLLDL